MRTDLLVVWPEARTGSGTPPQRIVIECKIRHGALDGTVDAGLEQTRAYMDRCAAEEGHLIVFDRSPGPWRDKVFRREETRAGATVTVWGMQERPGDAHTAARGEQFTQPIETGNRFDSSRNLICRDDPRRLRTG